MTFNPNLNPSDTINNHRLREIFKCSPQGGMRRSHKTNTLVIISDHTKSIYKDRWIDDNFHYTGMELEGDQRLNFSQNKTLAESHSNGVDLFLFEVFEHGDFLALRRALPPYLKGFTIFGYKVGWRYSEIAALSWKLRKLKTTTHEQSTSTKN